jgi:hypothetical protein
MLLRLSDKWIDEPIEFEEDDGLFNEVISDQNVEGTNLRNQVEINLLNWIHENFL